MPGHGHLEYSICYTLDVHGLVNERPLCYLCCDHLLGPTVKLSTVDDVAYSQLLCNVSGTDVALRRGTKYDFARKTAVLRF